MIRLEGLTFSFKKKCVLDNLTVTIPDGINGILGPNGCGKTTLFRCICGLYENYKGRVLVGEEVDASKKDVHVGYLPQNFSLIRDLKVKECMRYFATVKGIASAEIQREIERTLEITHMSDRAEAYCRELSGGMVRRIVIAQALLGNPDILVFDEPTVGLDPEERMSFKQICRSLDAQTVLMSTHIVEDVTSCCDNILIMDDGKFIFSGTEETLSAEAADYDRSLSPAENGYLGVIHKVRSGKVEKL